MASKQQGSSLQTISETPYRQKVFAKAEALTGGPIIIPSLAKAPKFSGYEFVEDSDSDSDKDVEDGHRPTSNDNRRLFFAKDIVADKQRQPIMQEMLDDRENKEYVRYVEEELSSGRLVPSPAARRILKEKSEKPQKNRFTSALEYIVEARNNYNSQEYQRSIIAQLPAEEGTTPIEQYRALMAIIKRREDCLAFFSGQSRDASGAGAPQEESVGSTQDGEVNTGKKISLEDLFGWAESPSDDESIAVTRRMPKARTTTLCSSKKVDRRHQAQESSSSASSFDDNAIEVTRRIANPRNRKPFPKQASPAAKSKGTPRNNAKKVVVVISDDDDSDQEMYGDEESVAHGEVEDEEVEEDNDKLDDDSVEESAEEFDEAKIGRDSEEEVEEKDEGAEDELMSPIINRRLCARKPVVHASATLTATGEKRKRTDEEDEGASRNKTPQYGLLKRNILPKRLRRA